MKPNNPQPDTNNLDGKLTTNPDGKLTTTQEWARISRQILTEIGKHHGNDLAFSRPTDEALSAMSEADQEDALLLADTAAKDRRGYLEALRPLWLLASEGIVKHTDPRVWKLTFAIGKQSFRPKYGEVEGMVLEIFDVPKTDAEVSALRVVTAPPRPRIEAGQDGQTLAASCAAQRTAEDVPQWTRYLAPTGNPDLDEILMKSLEATRRGQGEAAAVRAAKIMAQQRIEAEENQRREVEKLLSGIPEEYHESFLHDARAKLHRSAKPLQVAQMALRMWQARHRAQRHTGALEHWTRAWIPANFDTDAVRVEVAREA